MPAARLEADDGLAAEAAAAKLCKYLPSVVQLDRRADARGDRALREHARHLAQSVRRYEGVLARRVVVRRDLALSEPFLVRREDRRDEAAAGFEDVGVAPDRLRAVDEIEDSVDPIRVRRAHCTDTINGTGSQHHFDTPSARITTPP